MFIFAAAGCCKQHVLDLKPLSRCINVEVTHLPSTKLQLWTYFLRYFHKVPAEAPQLELKASYGLAEPVAFELPPLSEQCSAEVYATFDLTKGAKNDKVLQLSSKLIPTKAG